MGTKTFSVGKRKARSSRGLARSCSLSLAACSLPAAAAVRMIYIHFCLMTEALKSATLKKNVFVEEAFVDDSKAKQPQPVGSGRSFGNGPDPQTAHGQFGLVALPAGRRVLGCPISR